MLLDKSTRITPKFQNSTNFGNVLDFLLNLDEESIAKIALMSNMDSGVAGIFNEIGKTIGAYPRPIINDGTEERELTNDEYSNLLKALARGAGFNGTINEWEELFYQAIGADTKFLNYPSDFAIVIKRTLTVAEKRIVELILEYNVLTISARLIGTTEPSYVVWQLDLSELDNIGFVEPW